MTYDEAYTLMWFYLQTGDVGQYVNNINTPEKLAEFKQAAQVLVEHNEQKFLDREHPMDDIYYLK